MLLRSVRLFVAALAVIIAFIFVASSYVNKTPPTEATKRVVCEVAPCIMADVMGHAMLLTDDDKVRLGKGDLFIMMHEGKAVVMITGYFLADLTAIETADWDSISMYLNNGKLTECSGGRGYRLSQAQLKRLSTLKDIDMVQAKADPHGFCSKIWQLVQG